MLRISMTAESVVRGMIWVERPLSVLFASSKPKDFRAGTAKLVVLAEATRDPGRNTTVPPLGSTFKMPFCAPRLPLGHLIPDSSVCFVSELLHPWYYLPEFMQTHRCPVEGRSSMSQMQASLQGPGRHNQAGFPSFPINHCLPHSTYLKETFLKVGHKLWHTVLGLNHCCLSQRLRIFGFDYLGNMALSEVRDEVNA